MALLQNYKNCKRLVATRSAQGHQCARNDTVRNVWRAPVPDAFSLLDWMFKICNDSHVFWHACPPDRTVRNVWRASPFDSVGPLGPHPWVLGPPRPPRDSKRFRLATIWAGNVAQGCPPDLTSACPRLHPDLRSDIFP